LHPVLFHLWGFPVPTYGVLYLTAFLASIGVYAWLARTEDHPFAELYEFGFQIAIAGEIGARLLFVIVEWDRFMAGSISARQFLVAGRVVLGGIIAGAAFCIWGAYRLRLPLWRNLEAALTGAVLGMAIGRLGCLSAGCCYGKPTDLRWGITFTDPLAQKLNGTPLHQALHPTQVLQFFSALAIFLVLLYFHRHRRYDGHITGLVFLLLGVMRFLMEFLRGDPRGTVEGLATSQWIGLGMIAGGAGLMIYRRRLNRENNPASDPV